MNTNMKFKYDNTKYVININLSFLKSKTRNYVFRTNEQIVDFFKEALNRGIIQKIQDKKLSVILLNYKERYSALFFEVFPNPLKETTTFIEPKYVINSTGKKYRALINAGFPKDRIFNMEDYIIQTRIVPRRNIDIAFHTQGYKDTAIKTYISQYLYSEKKWFFEKYGMISPMAKIVGIIFTENPKILVDEVVDKEPFWLWLVEEGDEDSFMQKSEKYLCCCSLISKYKDKEKYYELLLDGIDKGFAQEKIKKITESEEKLYDIEININKVKKIKKAKGKGLKIVKKGEKR